MACVLCSHLGATQTTRTEVHHLRASEGMAQRASDFLTIALCTDCHTGPGGLHGSRSRWRLAKWGEHDALAATIKALT
jgi:hypothetical protein